MNKRYGNVYRVCAVLISLAAAVMTASGIYLMCTGYNTRLSSALIAASVIILAVFIALGLTRRKLMDKFLDMVAENSDGITANILEAFPIPILVTNIDGSIRWHNRGFAELIGKNSLMGAQIANVIEGVKWGDILKTKSTYSKSVVINDKRYIMTGRFVKDRNSNEKETYSVYLYFIDKSEYDKIKRLYEAEKTDIAVISIDNYDEVMQRMDDGAEERIVSGVRKHLSEWAQMGDAILKRQDNDRYFMIFDHAMLEKYIEDKFSVLEKVRAIGREYKAAISVSIGIGSGGNLTENEQYSRSAMEMTQGRGGDQVCVKTNESLRFYGGSAKEYEKSNRVKTRAVAAALKQFILNTNKVFLMGHSAADYDCFGAAMALQRAARELGTKPYIVMDNNSPAIRPMREKLDKTEEYDDMFISKGDAEELIDEDSLLIVLDTHRPSMLPCPNLIKHTNKIVVIDHHRRSTEFISPCTLVYHEPYASSVCEMVTELMDYMDMGKKMTRAEAECLYTGILMDTKNFLVKTSVRTFEAASYLRRLGINTLDVKKLFNVNKSDYDNKVDIVKTSVEICPGFSMAVAPKTFSNIRVVASQAADEMLNIGETEASIVIYPMDNGYGLCARSIGNINVQILMEGLGGGGHATIAGAQIKSKDLSSVKRKVIDAAQEYLKNR